MSTTSTTRSIQFLQKSGTYEPFIVCSWGELYQDYEAGTGGSFNYSPDFSAMSDADRPILSFVAVSTRQTGNVDVTSIEVKIGANTLTFAADGVCNGGGWANCFKLLQPSANGGNWGLKVIGNPASYTGNTSFVIQMTGTISNPSSGSLENHTAVANVRVQRTTGSQYHVSIGEALRPGQTTPCNFTLDNDADICRLKAFCRLGNAEVTTGVSYQWQEMVSNSTGADPWQDISGATAQTLDVTTSDIDTYGCFRVLVSIAGTVVGQDIQGVWDTTDPLDIEACPNPADETIESGNANRDHVTYKPKVVKRDSGEWVQTFKKFKFAVLSSSGVIVNTESGLTPNDVQTYASYDSWSGFSVTANHAAAAGGALIIVITAVE